MTAVKYVRSTNLRGVTTYHSFNNDNQLFQQLSKTGNTWVKKSSS